MIPDHADKQMPFPFFFSLRSLILSLPVLRIFYTLQLRSSQPLSQHEKENINPLVSYAVPSFFFHHPYLYPLYLPPLYARTLEQVGMQRMKESIYPS